MFQFSLHLFNTILIFLNIFKSFKIVSKTLLKLLTTVESRFKHKRFKHKFDLRTLRLSPAESSRIYLAGTFEIRTFELSTY